MFLTNLNFSKLFYTILYKLWRNTNKYFYIRNQRYIELGIKIFPYRSENVSNIFLSFTSLEHPLNHLSRYIYSSVSRLRRVKRRRRKKTGDKKKTLENAASQKGSAKETSRRFYFAAFEQKKRSQLRHLGWRYWWSNNKVDAHA